jgi:hypothetical protein
MKKNISKFMVLSSLLAGFLIIGPVAAEAVIPAQFLAKMYTEALGRAPDQGGWQGWVNWFQSNACSQATLRTGGEAFYLSPEFANLGYDNAAKLLTAYRGILNREPDEGGFRGWLSYLNSGGSWQTVLDGFFNSSDFNALVGQICSVDPYSFGPIPALDIYKIETGVSSRTQAGLETDLSNVAPSCGTVRLHPKEVVTLTHSLVIPSCVTLSTEQNPDHFKYARMGRLVRGLNFDPINPVTVEILPRGVLDGVWVDGQRLYVGYNGGAANINARGNTTGATNTTVRNSRSSNPAGWTALRAGRDDPASACGSISIRLLLENNLITNYASEHFLSYGINKQSDGISVSCENAEVRGNHIVDATDGGIVLFKAEQQGVSQQSIVHNNTIVAAGSSMYWALVASEDFSCNGLDNPSFSGNGFYNNTLWSGPNSHIDLALGVGTRTMVPPTTPGPGGCTLQHNTGTGATFSGNTTGSLSVTTMEGINVAGMNNVTVQNNNLTANLTLMVRCPVPNSPPSAYVAFDNQFASGTIQDPKQGFPDSQMKDCIITSPH